MKELKNITLLTVLCIAIVISLFAREGIFQSAEERDGMSQLFLRPDKHSGDAYEDYKMRIEYMLGLGQEVTDSLISHSDKSIHIKHSRHSNAEIFYILNLSNKQRKIMQTFELSGLQPELWDPAIAGIRDLPSYKQEGGVTTVPLELNRYESVFVVFRKPASYSPIVDFCFNYPNPDLLALVNRGWRVESSNGPGNPKFASFIQGLISWIGSSAEQSDTSKTNSKFLNNFNIYKKITVESDVIINFESSLPDSRVWINGYFVGSMWTSPQRLKITDYVRQGENEIIVEVGSNEDALTLSPSDIFGSVEINALSY